MARKRKWTQEAIFASYNDFIKKNGRLPTKQEIIQNTGILPLPRIIKLNLGMTQGEFIHKFYSQYVISCYNGQPKEYWINEFKKTFLELGSPTEDKYNKSRKKESPNTQAIRRWVGNVTWNQLLDICNLDVNEKKVLYNVNFEIESFDSNNVIDICKKLSLILENKSM